MVHYRCKCCGGDHPAPVPFAEKLYFDASATLDLTFECPISGTTACYNKTDLFLPETEPQPALRTWRGIGRRRSAGPAH